MKRSEIQEERFYLLHTRDAIADMRSYTATERDVFLEERMRQDGVIRTLEVIGEAVNGRSAETRARCPGIPWRQIAGMRDKMIHGYFGVNLELVWTVIERDLPGLEQAVAALLAAAGDPSAPAN